MRNGALVFAGGSRALEIEFFLSRRHLYQERVVADGTGDVVRPAPTDKVAPLIGAFEIDLAGSGFFLSDLALLAERT